MGELRLEQLLGEGLTPCYHDNKANHHSDYLLVKPSCCHMKGFLWAKEPCSVEPLDGARPHDDNTAELLVVRDK